MKTINPDPTDTTFLLPVAPLLAVGHARGTDPSRAYLRGVYVDKESDGATVVVATDGHMLLWQYLADSRIGSDVPRQISDHDSGFILVMDHADKALKSKRGDGPLWIYGDAATGLGQVLRLPVDGDSGWPRVGVLEIEIPQDDTFPDWRRIRPAAGEGDHGCAPSFDMRLLARVHAAVKGCGNGNEGVVLSTSAPGDPIRVDTRGCAGLSGVIMPFRVL